MFFREGCVKKIATRYEGFKYGYNKKGTTNRMPFSVIVIKLAAGVATAAGIGCYKAVVVAATAAGIVCCYEAAVVTAATEQE